MIIIIIVIFIIMQTSGWEQEWRSLRAPRKTVRLRLQLDTTADPDKKNLSEFGVIVCFHTKYITLTTI